MLADLAKCSTKPQGELHPEITTADLMPQRDMSKGQGDQGQIALAMLSSVTRQTTGRMYTMCHREDRETCTLIGLLKSTLIGTTAALVSPPLQEIIRDDGGPPQMTMHDADQNHQMATPRREEIEGAETTGGLRLLGDSAVQ